MSPLRAWWSGGGRFAVKYSILRRLPNLNYALAKTMPRIASLQSVKEKTPSLRTGFPGTAGLRQKPAIHCSPRSEPQDCLVAL